MARTNIPFGGFKYWGSTMGQNIVPNEFEWQVADDYATAIFAGDPLKLVSDGTVAVAAAGDATIFGIATGSVYNDVKGNLVRSSYLPAATSYSIDRMRSRVTVIPATAYTIFEVCTNAAVSTVAAARNLVWNNADHVATAAGNTSTGRSGFELAIGGAGTATAQWRLFNIAPDPNNDVTLTQHRWLVIANEVHNWPGVFSTTGI